MLIKVGHSIARASLSHHNPYIFHHIPSTLYYLIMNEIHYLAFAQQKIVEDTL